MAERSLGTASIRVKLDLSQIKPSLDAMKKNVVTTLNGAGDGFRRMESQGTRAFSRIEAEVRQTSTVIASIRTPLGAIASLLGTISFGSMIRQALELSSSFEQTNIAFETMLGSADAATGILADLEDFAKNTPFNFKELTKGTQKLVAYGFEVEQVIPMLNGMGNAIAAVGGGADEFNRLTLALGQIRAKGKASAEELRQLSELGLPINEILSKALGLTAEQVQNIGDYGVQSADVLNALFQAFDSRFGGLMEKQSKTLKGLFSNLQDTAQITLKKMGDYFDNTFKLKSVVRGLTSITTAIGEAFSQRSLAPIGIAGVKLEALKVAALAVGLSALPAAARGFKALATSANFAIKRMLPFIAIATAIVAASKLIKHNIFGLGVAWGNVTKFINKQFQKIKDIYTAYTLNSKTVNAAVARIFKAMGTIFLQFGNVVATVIAETVKTLIAFSKALNSISNVTRPILVGIGTLFIAYMARPVQEVANTIAEAYDFIRAVSATLMQKLRQILSPLGGVFASWGQSTTDAISNRLVASLSSIELESELANRGLNSLREGAAAIAQVDDAFNNLSATVGDARKNIATAFAGFDGEVVTAAFADMKAASSEAVDTIGRTWRALQSGLTINVDMQVGTEGSSEGTDYGTPFFEGANAADAMSDALEKAGRAASAAGRDIRTVNDVLESLEEAQKIVAEKFEREVIDATEAATLNMNLLERAIDEIIRIDADASVLSQLIEQLQLLRANSPEAAKALRELKEQITADFIRDLSLKSQAGAISDSGFLREIRQFRAQIASEFDTAIAIGSFVDADSLSNQLEDIDSAIDDLFSRASDGINQGLEQLRAEQKLGLIDTDSAISTLQAQASDLRKAAIAAFNAGDNELGRSLSSQFTNVNAELETALNDRQKMLDAALDYDRELNELLFSQGKRTEAEYKAQLGTQRDYWANQLAALTEGSAEYLDALRNVLELEEKIRKDDSLEQYNSAVEAANRANALEPDAIKQTNALIDAQRQRTLDLAKARGISASETIESANALRQLQAQLRGLQSQQSLDTINNEFALFGDRIKQAQDLMKRQKAEVDDLANRLGVLHPEVATASAEFLRLEANLKRLQRESKLDEGMNNAQLAFGLTGERVDYLNAKIRAQQAFVNALATDYTAITDEVRQAQAALDAMRHELAIVQRDAAIDKLESEFNLFADSVTRASARVKVQQSEIRRLASVHGDFSDEVRAAQAELRNFQAALDELKRQDTLSKQLEQAQFNFQRTGDEAAYLTEQIRAQRTFINSLAGDYDGLSDRVIQADAELKALEARLAAVNLTKAQDEAQKQLTLFGDELGVTSTLIRLQRAEVNRLAQAYGEASPEVQAAMAIFNDLGDSLIRLKREERTAERIAETFRAYALSSDRVEYFNNQVSDQQKLIADLAKEFGPYSTAVIEAQEKLDGLAKTLASLTFQQAKADNLLKFRINGDEAAYLTAQIQIQAAEVSRLAKANGLASDAYKTAKNALDALVDRQEAFANGQKLEQINREYERFGDEVQHTSDLIAEQIRLLKSLEDGNSDGIAEAQANLKELRLELVRLQAAQAENDSLLNFDTNNSRGDYLKSIVDIRRQQVEGLLAVYNEVTDEVRAAQDALEAAELALAGFQAASSEPMAQLAQSLRDATNLANAKFAETGNQLLKINEMIAAQRDYVLGVKDAQGTQNQEYINAIALLDELRARQQALLNGSASGQSFDVDGFIAIQDIALNQAEQLSRLEKDSSAYIEALRTAMTAFAKELENLPVGSAAYEQLKAALEQLEGQYNDLTSDPLTETNRLLATQRYTAKLLGKEYDVIDESIAAVEGALESYIAKAREDGRISKLERKNIKDLRAELKRLREDRERSITTLQRMSTAFKGVAEVLGGEAGRIYEGLSLVTEGFDAIVKKGASTQEVLAGIATAAGGLAKIAGDAPDSLGNSLVEGYFAAGGAVAELATGLPFLGKIGATVGKLVSSVLGDLSNGAEQVANQIQGMAKKAEYLSEALIRSVATTKRVNRGGILGLFGATKEAIDEDATKIALDIANSIIGTLQTSLAAANFDKFAKAFDLGIDKILQKQLIKGFLLSPQIQKRIAAIVKKFNENPNDPSIQAEREALKTDTANFYNKLRGLLPDLYEQNQSDKAGQQSTPQAERTLEIPPTVQYAIATPLVDASQKFGEAADRMLEAAQMLLDFAQGGVTTNVNINGNTQQQSRGSAWRLLQNG